MLTSSIFLMRAAKASMVGLMGAFLLVIAANNVLDYGTNKEFVTHVLSMDTTFKRPGLMWRAIENPLLHDVAYILIILCEIAAGILCGLGAFRLARRITGDAAGFYAARTEAILGLSIGLSLWFGGFLIVGGEWFAMWQSSQWNGQNAAFRMFMVTAVTLILLDHRD